MAGGSRGLCDLSDPPLFVFFFLGNPAFKPQAATSLPKGDSSFYVWWSRALTHTHVDEHARVQAYPRVNKEHTHIHLCM